MSRPTPSGSVSKTAGPAKRPSSSKVVSTTFQEISQNLSSFAIGQTEEKLPALLEVRLQIWKDLKNPFGKPNPKSRAEVSKDVVLLPDNVLVRVEPNSREYIFAISSHFDIDEINAFILFQSFIYNQGLSDNTDTRDNAEFVESIVKEITPFFYGERRAVYRILVPLLRVHEEVNDPLHNDATEFLPKIIPDRVAFARTILSLYQEKTRAPLPDNVATDPHAAARWAKDNLKDQLVLLEIIFWAMFSYVPVRGPLIEELYKTAYDTHLGSRQENDTLLLDAESSQLQKDIAAVWLLIMVEVLELEILSAGDFEISDTPADKDIYLSSPDSLRRIHKMVMDHQNVVDYSCVSLAWAIVLSRLEAAAAELEECPKSYRDFLDTLDPGPSRSKDGRSIPQVMLKRCLGPEVGVFSVLQSLLTTTSLFVTSIAWQSDSAISDPNSISYRSVLKGLLVSLASIYNLELIPDFDTVLEVWISLFGRAESQAVADLCLQFWREDAIHPMSRAILDIPRSRFPVQPQPFLRLLRSLCASGFSNSDPLASIKHRHLDPRGALTRAECAKNAVVHLQNLPSYTQIVPASACSGPHALYEKVPERFGTSSTVGGPLYTNIRPIRLPGGSLLPAKSAGRLLSPDGEEYMIVLWQHQHSGWLLLKEILYEYAVGRRLIPPASSSTPSSYGALVRQSPQQLVTLTLVDIGVELEESIIAEILELLRTVIAVDPQDAAELLGVIEQNDPETAVVSVAENRPDLAHLVLVILEDALARSGSQSRRPNPNQTPLIASAFGLLASMMSVRDYARQVWLFCRSSTLFDNTKMYTSSVLAAERVSGSYPITRALLLFVQSMFTQAYSGMLVTLSEENPKLQTYKEDVLMRALRFVHAEIWMEHVGWKYVQLSERFEVGRLLSTLYGDILDRVAPTDADVPLASISQAVFEALVLKATTSSINPLITAITTSTAVLRHASSLRRFADLNALWLLLGAHLRVIRVCLTYKQKVYANEGHCLLEQALCSRASGNGAVNGGSSAARARVDPLDALASFVSTAEPETGLPLEAMRVLYALCTSLASTPSSALTIVGHLSNPEATVTSLVDYACDPYRDLDVRLAIWKFMALAVDKEPALGSLFVNGRFQIPVHKPREDTTPSDTRKVSGFKTAQMGIEVWKDWWEFNPVLLSAVLAFLAAVWEHGAEHGGVMESVKDDGDFWDEVGGIVKEELAPAPEYSSSEMMGVPEEEDGEEGKSVLNEGVADHAARVLAKTYATRIVALDIGTRRVKGGAEGKKKDGAEEKPRSYKSVEGVFKSVDQLTDHLNEAIANSYDPAIFDEFTQTIETTFPKLSLKWLEWQSLPGLRELGDNYAFRKTNLWSLISAYVDEGNVAADELLHNLLSINMNLSLANVQVQLGESWQLLLQKVAPYLKGNAAMRPTILSLGATVAEAIAVEQRAGNLMSTIHGVRLSVLLSLLELAWFSLSDLDSEIKSFLGIVDSVRAIIVNESQSPILSIRGTLTTPFHRTLLQIVYFCLRQCRNLARKPKALDAERRLNIAAMIDVTLLFVIDSLRFVFDNALGRLDLDLDTDMELLVAVFEQATRTDINPSTQLWLTRCQETDVLRASLNLFVQSDITGLSQLDVLRSRKRPLYTPHILTFHISFASLPTPAERLASEGVLIAYSNNSLTPLASSGHLDPSLPSDLPGERNPAHQAYCIMLSVVSGVITALGMQKHFFDKEACGFVQLYGSQIERALSWGVGDVLTLAGVEEMERTVGLFGAIAGSAPKAANRNDVTAKVLSAFSSNALLLIQQLNYALSHPNQLAGLLEPVTMEEKVQLERESANGGASASSGGFAEVLDPVRRPFLTRVVHRLFGLASDVVCALIAVGESDLVLRGEVEDLPASVALVVPHSKVVLGEPASMGTLIELANCTLDILSHLVSRPAGQSLGPPSSTSTLRPRDQPLDVRQAILTTQQTLECVLFYATTQLGAWLAKPDLFEDQDGKQRMMGAGAGSAGEGAGGGMGGEVDMEADVPESGTPAVAGGENKKGGRRRESMSLAERLRRGMTGEMANELKSLMEKARPVLQKSRDVVGSGADKERVPLGKGKEKEVDVDVVKVLIGFLSDRIMGRT